MTLKPSDSMSKLSEAISTEIIDKASNQDWFSEAISYLSSHGILAIIIAFAGWFFIYYNSRVLQKRNETWAIVKNISDLLQDIETQSKKFWLSSEDSENALLYEAEINSKLNELERWLKHLSIRVENATTTENNYKRWTVDIFKDSTLDTELKTSMAISQRLKKVVLLQKHTNNIKENIDSDFGSTFL